MILGMISEEYIVARYKNKDRETCVEAGKWVYEDLVGPGPTARK